MAAQPTQQQRMAVVMDKRAAKTLENENVQPGSTIMEAKQAPGTIGRPTPPLLTNMYTLDMRQKIKVYRYEVTVHGLRRGTPLERDLSLRSRSDYLSVSRRLLNAAIFSAFKDHLGATVENQKTFDYNNDLQRILFTLKPMEVPHDGLLFNITHDALNRVYGNYLNGADTYTDFRLRIVPTETGHETTLADFSHLTNDAALAEHSILEQFLGINTAQEICNTFGSFVSFSTSRCYLLTPFDFGFTREDVPPFYTDRSFLAIGVGKGVRPIQAPDGNVTAGIVVQVKKSPFHINVDSTVYQKLEAIIPTLNVERIEDRPRKLAQYVIGIWVQTIYGIPGTGVKQRFRIDGLTETNAHTQEMTFESRRISVAAYYQRRYNITLRFPDMYLCVRHIPGQAEHSYYPAELLRILDNQRVKCGQQTSQSAQQMIRLTAVSPSTLIAQNAQVKTAINLDHSPYMAAAGVQAGRQPIEVAARELPHPALQFDRVTERPKVPEATFTGHAKYLIPANCTKWAAIAINGRFGDGGRREDYISDSEWRTFVQLFAERNTHMGMQFGPATDIDIIGVGEPDSQRVGNMVKNLAKDGYEFVLIGHPNGADDAHNMMKFSEQKTEVVTQGVKFSTVRAVVNERKLLALENIVHKTNVKLGGLNYAIVPDPTLPYIRELLGNETLVIGFATSHPVDMLSAAQAESGIFFGANGLNGNGGVRGGTGVNGQNGLGVGAGQQNGTGAGQPGTSAAGAAAAAVSSGTTQGPGQAQVPPSDDLPIIPSVIGFAANIGPKHCSEYVGDYCYQEPLRDERVELIAQITKRCLLQFHQFRGVFPKRVLIYRNGCAEGSFQKILKYEVPMMRKAMADLGCPQAKITLMVVNKLQPVRVYPKNPNPAQRPSEQNIKPGTVVDTGIVHPIYSEFFLSPHRGIQGTSAISRYTVLLDDNKFNADTLQLICHHLSFGHQIVYSPTSLPTPVMVAEECAKRGRNNFNMWVTKRRLAMAAANGNGGNNAQRQVEEDWEAPVHSYVELTNRLSMEHTFFLRDMRFNA